MVNRKIMYLFTKHTNHNMYFFQPPYKGRGIIGLLYIILECFGLFGINNEDLVYLEYVCWALIPRSEMCPGASMG